MEENNNKWSLNSQRFHFFENAVKYEFSKIVHAVCVLNLAFHDIESQSEIDPHLENMVSDELGKYSIFFEVTKDTNFLKNFVPKLQKSPEEEHWYTDREERNFASHLGLDLTNKPYDKKIYLQNFDLLLSSVCGNLFFTDNFGQLSLILRKELFHNTKCLNFVLNITLTKFMK